MKTTKKFWTGRPKEKGQIFSARVLVKKVMTGPSGIPNVIEINGEDYIRRPKNRRMTNEPIKPNQPNS